MYNLHTVDYFRFYICIYFAFENNTYYDMARRFLSVDYHLRNLLLYHVCGACDLDYYRLYYVPTFCYNYLNSDFEYSIIVDSSGQLTLNF